MSRKYDEIDRRIIYRLTQNARDIVAPEIERKLNSWIEDEIFEL